MRMRGRCLEAAMVRRGDATDDEAERDDGVPGPG
jgi:hypothetical protein